MNLEEILNIDIKNLSDKQYEALKKHTIDKLQRVIALLQFDKLQEVADLLAFSPDGDGWGRENYYINFSYIDGKMMDIQEILYKMSSLKNKEIKFETKIGK